MAFPAPFAPGPGSDRPSARPVADPDEWGAQRFLL